MIIDSAETVAERRVEDVTTRDRSPATIAILSADMTLQATVATLLEGARGGRGGRGGRYRISERHHAQALAGFLCDERTDAILLDLKLPMTPATDVAASLRASRRDPTIPVIGICNRGVLRQARLAAIERGVWDVIEIPVSADELVTKLDNWVSLKRSFDGVRSGILVDIETGHYSAAGMKRRLRELASLAERSSQSLSCVLFGLDPIMEGVQIPLPELERAAREFSGVLHDRTRPYDVIGRIEPNKFMVLAPQTPQTGAVRLAERFTTWTVRRRVQGVLPVTFSAGVAGVDGKTGQLESQPELLLVSASKALNTARAAGAAQVAIAWGRATN
ncbi:MAG: hypothetical protein V3U38_06515 [Gemmatimonadota bacterium]